MSTRKKLIAIAAVTGATLFSALPARAAPPSRTSPLGSYTIHIPADQTPCGAFTALVEDNERVTTFVDQSGQVTAIRVTGALRFTVTSDLTGRSIDLNISGPGFFVPGRDTVFTGAMLLYGPATFALVHGRAVFPGANVDVAVITGKRTDLCPVLVG